MWDVFFKDANTGVLCADGAFVSRSTNGGVTWNQISLPLYQFQAPNLYRLIFVGNTGWTIGEGGSPGMGRLVYKTTDFGSSWDSIGRVPYPSNELNYSIFFSSLNTGYAGGTTGYIFKTTNGGFNWIQQVSPSNGFRNDFWFYNDSLGWCVGGGGYILHTTNGGTYVAVQPISNMIPENFKLFQNYPNPFNPYTVIRYELKPKVKSQKAKIKIVVFDVTGKEVIKLVDEEQRAGTFEVDFSGYGYSSGVYFYSLIINDNTIDTKRMVLLK